MLVRSYNHIWIFCKLQLLSRVRLFATPWTAAREASLSIANSQRLLKLLSIDSMMPSNHLNIKSLYFTISPGLLKLRSTKPVMPSNHLILCCPLLPLPSIFPSISVFSNELVLPIRWPKYWSFSFNFSPSNEYSGLISFRMDWTPVKGISLQPYPSNDK